MKSIIIFLIMGLMNNVYGMEQPKTPEEVEAAAGELAGRLAAEKDFDSGQEEDPRPPKPSKGADYDRAYRSAYEQTCVGYKKAVLELGEEDAAKDLKREHRKDENELRVDFLKKNKGKSEGYIRAYIEAYDKTYTAGPKKTEAEGEEEIPEEESPREKEEGKKDGLAAAGRDLNAKRDPNPEPKEIAEKSKSYKDAYKKAYSGLYRKTIQKKVKTHGVAETEEAGAEWFNKPKKKKKSKKPGVKTLIDSLDKLKTLLGELKSTLPVK